ncbi:MAG: universal stress protein [Ktedonobacteraceae bacterium]
MFQRIVVALDGSTRAEQVLRVAARLAQFSGGSVILLRVVTATSHTYSEHVKTPAGTTVEVPPLVEQDSIDSEYEEAKSFLEITAKADILASIHVETKVLFGAAASEILSATQSLQADIIIMCSHGYTGLKRWRLGSVAQKVARHSPIPVLVLHEDAGLLTNLHPEGNRPVRILVALDGSSLAEEALLPAAQLSAALSAPALGSLHLARILPLPTGHEYGQRDSLTIAREKALTEVRAYLSLVEQKLRAGELAHLNLLVTSSLAVNTDIANMLLRKAEIGEERDRLEGFQGCDAIAIATHGRGSFQRILLGSVTERILSATRLPLLIVRPQERETPSKKSRKAAETALS